jgi:alpha-beta hydrolase superfamily lysophospholipase
MLASAGCGEPGPRPAASDSAAAGTVAFSASDGVLLKASWTPSNVKVFLVMHGLGAGRGEWDAFARAAARRGWGTLAFDARGHGDSGGGSYADFKTADSWAAILADFDGALAWLEANGVARDRIVLGGASVGANLALHAALRHSEVPSLMLLSPGWVYAGIPLHPALARAGRKTIVAAAPSDGYAYESSGRAIVLAPEPKPVFLEGTAGHGVGMFSGEAGAAFLEAVLDFFAANPTSSGNRASP